MTDRIDAAVRRDLMPRKINKQGTHFKKACSKCGHGIAIHRLKRGSAGMQPCNHPGCRCKNYETGKP